MYNYGYGSYGNGMDYEAISGIMSSMWIVTLLLSIFSIVCWWKLFTKAGKPGWGSLIPIYNTILMLDVAGMSWKWILAPFISVIVVFLGAILGALLDIPVLIIVGFIIFVIMLIMYYIAFVFMLPFKVARNFGKGDGFAILTVFFSPICYAILAFGDAVHVNNGFSSKYETVNNQVNGIENNMENQENNQVISMYCPFCGSPVYGDSKFCSNCGSNVK